VDVFGDEGVGALIENTLKADGGTSTFAQVGVKIPSENATSGWPRTKESGFTVGASGPGRGGNPRRGAAADQVNHRVRGTHRFAEEGLEVERRAGGSRLAGERV